MNYSDLQIWGLIIALGIGTFIIRFSFLGLLGGVKLPEWLLRHLRYTPVAVLPGLVAPLVIWPEATAGAFDFPRVAAACVTVLVGVFTRSLIWAILAGATTLYVMLFALG